MALPAIGLGETINLGLAISLIYNIPDTKPVPNAVFNQSPVRGSEENSLISWRPNPFNNPQDNCNQAKQKLKELQALKKWRMDDIKKHNPQYEKGKRLTPSGKSHRVRPNMIQKSIDDLESYIKNYCDPECPTTS